MPDGWEYKTLSVNVTSGRVHDATLDEQLTELGREGWELVSVTPLVAEGKTTCLIHHLRRIEERARKAGFQP
jgi:hypothetical protein